MRTLSRAAVVVVALVSASTLTACGDDSRPDPLTLPSRTSEAAHHPTPSPSDKLGAPPKITYVLGRTVYLPNGTTVVLRRRHVKAYNSITPNYGGYLATDTLYFEGTMGLQQYDAEGGLIRDLGTVAAPPVTSADGSRACWITFTPPEATPVGPQRLTCMDLATARMTEQRIEHPAGTVWVSQVSSGAISRVRYHTRSGREQIWESNLDTDPTLVRDLSDLSGSGGQRNLGVRSPDGSHLARNSGLKVRIFARKKVIAAAAPGPNPSIHAIAWEDNRHLLLGCFKGRRGAIFRLGIDGRVDIAHAWTKVPPAAAFGFAAPSPN